MKLMIDLVNRCLGRLGELLAALAGPAPVPVRSTVEGRERGASLVEYALLVGLIAVVCIGAVTFFGTEVTDSLSTSGGSIAN